MLRVHSKTCVQRVLERVSNARSVPSLRGAGELGGVLPYVVKKDIGNRLRSCYNWALGFIEGPSVVFNVAHLPHQSRDAPAAAERNGYRKPIGMNQTLKQRKGASPVEAILQPFADGAEVGGVRHGGAVQRVVLQVHR